MPGHAAPGGSGHRKAMRLPCLLFAVSMLAACAHQPVPPPSHNPMAEWVPSPNHDARGPGLVVLHFTDQESVEQSLRTLSTRNSGGRVSAHYLIGRDGKRYQLVDDDRRAWHAGAGSWGAITDVNSASIGIELDNDGKSPFPQEQIDSLLALLGDLTERHRIPRTHVVGHEDIAPTRKRDPGPLFPWKALAEAGFGLWPEDDAPPPPAGFDPWQALRLIGYPLQDRSAAARAFRSHYRGVETDALEQEDLRILHALSRQLAPPAETPVSATARDAARAGMVEIRETVPDAVMDIRYAGADNFTGDVVEGYNAPKCYLLQPVAEALGRVAGDLRNEGLRLQIFDCYRPVRSVQRFMAWAEDLSDQRTKAGYYPNLDKSELVGDYIARSSGHSRGATVDLSLARCAQDRCVPLDMGTDFDLFDARANTAHPRLTGEQRRNRQTLLDAMARHGFHNYPMEWWHYTFRPEPTPHTAYDFPVE